MNNNREKLVEAIDIVDEIGSTIELEAKGRNYVGLCPFHADNNPSFTVSAEKKIYKCFVCGEGGDVVKFYRMYNHISNQAAIEALADKYNVKIERRANNFQLKPSNHVLNDINKFYVTALHSTEGGSKAVEYLKKRGLTSETINHFHLGYGYEQADKLYQYLEKKIENESNYTQTDIAEINHFTNKRDFFASRITIPIIKYGNVIGFGGRTTDGNSIKYLNSKDSKTFQKREVLFNFEEALRLSPDRSLIVVEGFFDVIKAHQFNIKNTVGLMGTSFTNNHIIQMKRQKIDSVFLALDSDKAGQDASLKIGKLLLKNGFKVKVIEYPEGKDLDEFLLTHSFEEFQSLKKNSLNFKVFETEQTIQNVSLLSLDEKDAAINELVNNLKQENDLVIEQVLSKIETSFKVSRDYLQKKLDQTEDYVQSTPEKVSDGFEYYDIPEMSGESQGYEEYAQYGQESTAPKPIVNTSNISFMSAQQLVIYRSMSSKKEYQELKKLKLQLNKELGIYEKLFVALDDFYSKYSRFDYVTFTNDNPQYALLINDLFEKEITENAISNYHLVEKIKDKTQWGIFSR